MTIYEIVLICGSSSYLGNSAAPHTGTCLVDCVQTLEPSARVPVCSRGAVNQTNPAKRERGTGSGPANGPGKHSTTAEN